MATVPGDPMPNVVPILPEWAKPTPADFLQAAAIVHERQEQNLRLALKDPEFTRAWEEGGWERDWEAMIPYGGAGGNPQTREQAIRQKPDREYIDFEYGPGKGGSLYFRRPRDPKTPTS